jgi:hypothetical protein
MLGQRGVTAWAAAPQTQLTATWEDFVPSRAMTAPQMSVREVRRENDWAPDEPGELVGLLLPAEDDLWVPATVFGAALGAPTDERLAESIARERGLSSLADRWWVRTPEDEWREAWLLEVKSDRVRLRWDNPMLMKGGHGEWLRLADAEIRRHRRGG